MNKILFFSGEYRKWSKNLCVHTTKHKACHRLVIKGLKHAFEDKWKTSILVKINRKEVINYTIVGDRLVFKDPLKPIPTTKKAWFGLDWSKEL